MRDRALCTCSADCGPLAFASPRSRLGSRNAHSLEPVRRPQRRSLRALPDIYSVVTRLPASPHAARNAARVTLSTLRQCQGSGARGPVPDQHVLRSAGAWRRSRGRPPGRGL